MQLSAPPQGRSPSVNITAFTDHSMTSKDDLNPLQEFLKGLTEFRDLQDILLVLTGLSDHFTVLIRDLQDMPLVLTGLSDRFMLITVLLRDSQDILLVLMGPSDRFMLIMVAPALDTVLQARADGSRHLKERT